MYAREKQHEQPANRPVECLSVVVVSSDGSAADLVVRRLLELNNVRVVTYQRAEDMVMNPPTVKVALVILAAPESPGSISRTLDWLRHRMPRCPVTVVGDFGCGQHEMAAREGGAFYLTRPVEPDQLSAILAHVLTTARYERTVTPGWGLAANTSRES